MYSLAFLQEVDEYADVEKKIRSSGAEKAGGRRGEWQGLEPHQVGLCRPCERAQDLPEGVNQRLRSHMKFLINSESCDGACGGLPSQTAGCPAGVDAKVP